MREPVPPPVRHHRPSPERPGSAFVRASRGARTYPGVPEENYWFRRHEAAYRLAARTLRERGFLRVLDVGCGEGYGAALLAGRAHVHAVELDAGSARHAARSYPRVRVVRADACVLPYWPSSFDAVVAMQVLEHFFCADRFLRQVRALLRPGGVALLSTPNRPTFSPDGEPSPFHVYEYTAEELEGLLGVHFSKVSVAGLHEGPWLRTAQRTFAGSLAQRLASGRYAGLPRGVRMVARAVRAGAFRPGPADGSLDLLATVEP